MRDNIFAEAYENPFATNEEWVPLVAENTNCAPGQDIPAFSTYRRLRVAAMFFIIRNSTTPRATTIETPIGAESFEAGGRATLAHRVRDWFLSDPA